LDLHPSLLSFRVHQERDGGGQLWQLKPVPPGWGSFGEKAMPCGTLSLTLRPA
jgi:hypothetical protein